MSGLSLFKLDDDLEAATDLLDEYVDEETGEIAVDAVALFDQIAGALDSKLLGWGAWFKNLRAEKEACEVEARKLRARARSVERKMAFVKSTIESHLDEGRVLKNGTARLGWRARSGITVGDIDRLPDEFVKVERTERKREIKAHLDTLSEFEREVRADAWSVSFASGKGLTIG